MDYDRIRDAIHKCIVYNEKVLNGKYMGLEIENEAALVDRIVQRHSDDFAQLVSKKDYYESKLFTWLQQNVKLDQGKASPNKRPNLPDPLYITNRYHAVQHVNMVIVNDDMKIRAIRELIIKHKNFQEDFKKQRDELIEQYNERKRQIQQNKGPQILSGVNESKVAKLREATESNLRSLDERMAYKMKQLSYENYELLRGLKVPFFYIDDGYKYPDLKQDQEFMLDLLRDTIELK
ncbi:hypothetical protein JA9_000437 [Meyerozyma sp. JA9]|nr:hypothetical protein JA9_000437 [Meyerozyma sp. JA9]